MQLDPLICKLQCLLCEWDIHLRKSLLGTEHSTSYVLFPGKCPHHWEKLSCRAALLPVLYVKSAIACEIKSSAGGTGERLSLPSVILFFPGFLNKYCDHLWHLKNCLVQCNGTSLCCQDIMPFKKCFVFTQVCI